MKTIQNSKKIIAVAAFGIFSASLVQAQLPNPGAFTNPPPPPAGERPVPPSPPQQPGLVPPPPPAAQELQQVAAYKGSVVKFSSNDDFIYDEFYLLNNGDSLLVKFPPHLGRQITNTIKTGSAVTVNGVINTAPMGEKELRMISMDAGGKLISDTGGIQPIPPAEVYTSGKGKITQLQTNREGVVNGLMVDSKIILRIPPHLANQITSVAKINSSVSYTGMRKAANGGEASSGDYTVIHCKTISLDGQQYLVQ